MNVAKAEKIDWMTYAEIKVHLLKYMVDAKCRKNGKSAAKPRTEEGSTTIRIGGVAFICEVGDT